MSSLTFEEPSIILAAEAAYDETFEYSDAITRYTQAAGQSWHFSIRGGSPVFGYYAAGLDQPGVEVISRSRTYATTSGSMSPSSSHHPRLPLPELEVAREPRRQLLLAECASAMGGSATFSFRNAITYGSSTARSTRYASSGCAPRRRFGRWPLGLSLDDAGPRAFVQHPHR